MKMTLEEAKEFFAHLYGGEHHIRHEIEPYGLGFSIRHDTYLSTFDSSLLTSLVFMAHDFAYRVEISPRSNTSITIAIHKRKREGGFSERHPELADAINNWNPTYSPEIEKENS